MNDHTYSMIIGSMKSGTTSLFDILTKHPNIAPCRVKEPCFFSDIKDTKDFLEVEKITRYEDLWSENLSSDKNLTLLEASTSYTKLPWSGNVAQRIRSYGLTPKFIFLARDPIERIRSHYNYMLGVGGFSVQESMVSKQFLELSRYYTQVRPFLEEFGVDNLLVLTYEDFVEDPALTTDKIFDFLELPPLRTKISLSRSNVTPKISKIERRIKALFPRTSFSFLPKGITECARRFLGKHSATINIRRVADAERDRIFELLCEDIDQFVEQFKIPKDRWPIFFQ